MTCPDRARHARAPAARWPGPEREFFIRKAIGWVLRDTGRRRPDLVAAWLEPRIGQVSGVTLREAVKPLPPETAARLLAAYRARPRARRQGGTSPRANRVCRRCGIHDRNPRAATRSARCPPRLRAR